MNELDWSMIKNAIVWWHVKKNCLVIFKLQFTIFEVTRWPRLYNSLLFSYMWCKLQPQKMAQINKINF